MFSKKICVFCLLVGYCVSATAEEVTLGWMNLDRCRKTEWNNNGIFGTPSPTYREAEQRAYVKLEYYDATAGRLAQEVKHCGERGVAAATVAAIVANVSAAAPSFYAVFGQCMGALYDRVSNLSLRWESECLW